MNEMIPETQEIFSGLKVVNLTPHPVRILDEDGDLVAGWASSGSLRICYDYTDGVIREAKISGITGIEFAEGADVVIVSRAMAMIPLGLPNAVRVYYPDGEVRDPDNPALVVGCRWLTALVRENSDDAFVNKYARALAWALNDAHSYGSGHGYPELNSPLSPDSAAKEFRIWMKVSDELTEGLMDSDEIHNAYQFWEANAAATS